MIQKITLIKDPVLRQVSKPISTIDKKISAIIKDLKETLKVQKDPEGIGLAAPQIGKNTRVFVMLDNGKIRTIINPEILKIEKVSLKPKKNTGKKIMEGCLSLPHFYGPLDRAEKITLKYLDEEGSEKTETFEGLPAQIVQHEIDHLNGVLFVDRLLEQKSRLFEYKNGEWDEVDL